MEKTLTSDKEKSNSLIINFDESYNYKIISDYTFDTKALSITKEGNKYRKYILLVLNDNGSKKYKDIQNISELNKYNNIISYYNIEEILSSCNYSDSIFTYAKYYKIENKICFIKYKIEDYDLALEFKEIDNQEIKSILKEL